MFKLNLIKNPRDIKNIVYRGIDSTTGQYFIGDELFSLDNVFYIHKTDDIMRQVDENSVRVGIQFSDGYMLFDGDVVVLSTATNYTDNNKGVKLNFKSYQVKYNKMSGFSFLCPDFYSDTKKFKEIPFTELSRYCWIIQEHNNDGSEIKYAPNTREDLIFLISCRIPFNQIDVSNVTDMSDVFCNFDNTQIQMDISGLSDWNVSNVTNMANMFENANIPYLDISTWNVSKVKNMSRMFYMFRTNLLKLDISNWNTSNVKVMSGMFAHSHIKSDISNWDVSNVTDMANMFAPSAIDCDISKWNVQSLRNFENMFSSSRMKFPIEWLYRMNEKNIHHFINVYTGAAIRGSLVD